MKLNRLFTMLMVGGALVACGRSQGQGDAADSTAAVEADSVVATLTDTASFAEAEEATEKAEGKKYVPASIGDCYVGERIRVPNDSGIWCELTFNADGTCELKSEMGNLKGTFTGTITGSEYNIAVKFSDGEEYDFVGTKDKLVADDGLVKYVVSLEM